MESTGNHRLPALGCTIAPDERLYEITILTVVPRVDDGRGLC
jgi:hypothetical protein